MSRITKGKFNKDREIQRDIKNTASNKQNFIDEIKNGLGEHIKKNPNIINKVERPKKTRLQKIVDTIKSLFKTF